MTDAEYSLIKSHADIGANLIASSKALSHLAPFIRHHHERWDGQGYPDGLAGEEIPLEARILNLCDSVEAMASDRPYHLALSIEEIMTEVVRCTGTQFDPMVAKAFVRIIERRRDGFIVNSARHVTSRPMYDHRHDFANVYSHLHSLGMAEYVSDAYREEYEVMMKE